MAEMEEGFCSVMSLTGLRGLRTWKVNDGIDDHAVLNPSGCLIFSQG